MGLAKKTTEKLPEGTQDFRTVESKPESGTTAAVERLKAAPKADSKPAFKQRDFNDVNDAKSIRILRQGAYQHAMVSPALAGLRFNNLDEYLALVKEAADKMIAMILAE